MAAGYASAGGPAGAAVTLAPVPDPAAYVNPLIGTGSGVNLFPGPDAPLGMLQWSPDTPSNPDGGGYNYADSSINGFSLTHLSGPGCPLYEDFEFLPTAQPVTTSPGSSWSSYTSAFSHDQETAHAGYYGVTLSKSGIQAQLTATTRAALGRFTYPAGAPATMLINASHSVDNHGSFLQIASPDTITGWSTGGQFCGHPTQDYTVYFAVTFDHPFTSYGTWQGSTATPGSASVTGDGTGGWVSFDTSASPVVNAKVAISYVSVSGAMTNLASASSDFDTVRAQTYAAWNHVLGKIGVAGGSSSDMTTFYTALYHSLLEPSTFSDANGQYLGFDFKVHTLPPGHVQYANFSGWDIYRSEVPLLAMLLPSQASDMMQSLVNDAEQGGYLPKWPTANVYTGMVGGDSADPMLADAYAFGARDFDVSTALSYMVKDADNTTDSTGQGWYSPRLWGYVPPNDWGAYLAEGYVPTNQPGDGQYASSVTQEFAVDDFTVAQLAGDAGDRSTEATFMTRGQNWQNLFDPGTGYVRARGPAADLGAAPADQTFGFEEGTGAQYTWMVPQNLAGLFTAMGGTQTAASRLDTFFTQLNAGASAPYDYAGNEPDLGSPWTYDYLGEPWKTQQVVREIMTQLYGDTPGGGEPGNDDLGAMSSWYVWAAIGLYPETPGTSNLALGSPLFPEVSVHLGNGRTISINAPQAAPGAPYVQNLTIGGQDWPDNYLPPHMLATGGTLDYTLATTPNTSRGTRPQASPPSYSQGQAAAIGFTNPWDEASTAPGQPATVKIGAQSEIHTPLTATWTAVAPPGITVSPSSGTLNLNPGGQATQPAAVSASANTAPGIYDIHITFTDAHGQQHLAPADLYLQTAGPPIGYTANTNANTVTPLYWEVQPDGTRSLLQGRTPIPVQSKPSGVAITPDGKYAYVANQLSNSVSVIDTATNTVAATIRVGTAPYGVAMAPDGQHVYVANNTSNSVSVIDTATNTVTATVPAGTGPFWVAVTPDGKTAYVSDNSANTVTPIDTATNTAGTPIPVGSAPRQIAISPDGSTAYVSNLNSNTVTPINTATNTAGTPIPLACNGPDAAAIDPANSTLYITCYGSGVVIPVNTATNQPGTPVQVTATPQGIAVGPEESTIYATDAANNEITPIQASDNAPGAPIEVLSPYGIAFAPANTG